MNWYYAQGTTQMGPIDDAEFSRLVSIGTIQPATLVWREGMASWQPFSQVPRESLPAAVVALPPAAPAIGGAPPVTGATFPATAASANVCSNCGGTFAPEDLIQIEGARICPNCKPIFVQRMKEGVAPIGTPADPDGFARQVIERGYSLDIGTALGRAWELMKENFWPLVGVNLLVMVVAQAIAVLPSLIPFLGVVLATGVSAPASVGIYWYALKLIRGEPVTLTDAFYGFSHFLQLFLTGIVMMSLILVCFLPGVIALFATGQLQRSQPGVLGILLLLVGAFPAIYLAISWLFSTQLVLDKQFRFWDAMQVSRKVIGEHWWSMFGFSFVMALVNIAGILACCLGVLVTMPLTMVAFMYAYEDIFSVRPAQ